VQLDLGIPNIVLLPDASPFWATSRAPIKYKGSVGYLIAHIFLALPRVVFAGGFFDTP
jgi:hypothetical protein